MKNSDTTNELSSVVFVEHDRALANAIKRNLEEEGIMVEIRRNKKKTIKELLEQPLKYKIILIDVSPRFDFNQSMNFCKEIREKNIETTIIIMIDQRSIEERVLLIDCGVKEYILKPFAFRELLDVLKKYLDIYKDVGPETLKIGQVIYDLNKKNIYKKNVQIHLTPKELAIFDYFVANRKHTLSREKIFYRIWTYNSESINNLVDVHIKNIRKKIFGKKQKNLLQTIRGLGYRLNI